MKRFLKTFIFAIMAIVVPVVVSSCSCSGNKGQTTLQASGLKYVFDIGEEFSLGDDASVKKVKGKTETTLSANEYSVNQNFNGSAEGIYSVVISAESLSYSYSVVVIDYDNLVAVEGDILEDVALPAKLNLVWKEANTSVGDAGTNSFAAIFSPDSNTSIEVTLPVQVSEAVKLTNSWAVEPSIENWVYGDAPSIPFGEAEHGEVEFEYYTNESLDAIYKLSTTPVVSGTYYLVAVVPEDDEYWQLKSEAIEFQIEKAVISVTRLKNDKITKVYDGGYSFNHEYLIENNFFEFSANSSADLSNLDVEYSAKFIDNSYQTTFSNVGSGKLSLTFTLNSESVNGGANFIFASNQLSNIIYFDNAEIVKATPSVATIPTAETLINGQTLSESELSGGEVVILLVSSPDSYKTVATEIEGTWSWANPETVIDESGTYEAIFTPTNQNINSVSTQISVDIISNDDVSAIIGIDGNSTGYYFDRSGNTFSYELPYNAESYKIKVKIPEGVQATYDVYFDDYEHMTNQSYTSEAEIGFGTQLWSSFNSYILKFHLTGDIQKDLDFVVTLAKPATIMIGESELKENEKVDAGEKLDFELKDPDIIVKLNGINLDEYNTSSQGIQSYSMAKSGVVSYTISLQDIGKTLNFEFFNAENEYLNYITVHVSEVFKNVMVNNQELEANQNSMGNYDYYYEFSNDTTSIDIDLMNPTIDNFSIDVTTNVNDRNELVEFNNQTIHFDFNDELKKITVVAMVGTNGDYMQVGRQINIYLIKETFVENVSFESVTSFDRTTNVVEAGEFVERLDVELEKGAENYTYSWFKSDGITLFDFKNVETKNEIILKIFDGENVVETSYFTLNYNFTIGFSYQASGSRVELFKNEDGSILLIAKSSDLNITVGGNFDVLFVDENGEVLENQYIIVDYTGERIFNLIIKSGEYLCRVGVHAYGITEDITNVLTRMNYNYNSMTGRVPLANDNIYSLRLPINVDFDAFANSLILDYDENVYSIVGSFDESIQKFKIEVTKINDETYYSVGFFNVDYQGQKSGNNKFSIYFNDLLTNTTLREYVGLEEINIDFGDISSYEEVVIKAENSYSLIEILLNGEVIISRFGQYTLQPYGEHGMTEGTYTIRVTSTDGINSHSVIINYVVEKVELVQITDENGKNYSVFMKGNTFDVEGDCGLTQIEGSCILHLSSDLVKNSGELKFVTLSFNSERNYQILSVDMNKGTFLPIEQDVENNYTLTDLSDTFGIDADAVVIAISIDEEIMMPIILTFDYSA